jgi:hypothetical protein
VLGLRPAAGRLLAPDDSHHPLAVISHAYWLRRFDGAPDVVGRPLALNGAHVTIVGVAPAGFSGVWLESPVDAWVPVAMQSVVGYTQNYSASESDPGKPWLPQDGIRWLELIVRAERLEGAETAALNAVFRPSVLEAAARQADTRERALLMR